MIIMKYRVFVSGNQSELREERFTVKDAIVNTGIFREFFEVFIFEDIAAGGNNPASRYLNEVKNSLKIELTRKQTILP